MIVSDEKALEIKRNEVTEWDGNPRLMWVWDDDLGVSSVEKMFVVYINPDKAMNKPVITDSGAIYDYCAEIVEQRMMTQREISRWLRMSPDREFKMSIKSEFVSTTFDYNEKNQDSELDDDCVVRCGNGEWEKATKEVLERDYDD